MRPRTLELRLFNDWFVNRPQPEVRAWLRELKLPARNGIHIHPGTGCVTISFSPDERHALDRLKEYFESCNGMKVVVHDHVAWSGRNIL